MVLNSKFLVALGIVISCAVYAFSIYRYVENDMEMAILDAILATSFSFCTLYIHITQRVEIARFLVIIIAFFGTLTAISMSPEQGMYWTYVTTLALYYLMPSYLNAVRLSMLLLLASTCILFLAGAAGSVGFLPFVVTILVLNFFAYLFVKNIEKASDELEKLTVTDSLTGLKNRRDYMVSISNVVNLHQRLNLPACLIYMDIDEFKYINDQFGHAEGDAVLVAVADCLKATLRKTDAIFRLGGDEFVILVEGTDGEHARVLAEKVRSEVEKITVPCGKNITLSLGGTEFLAHDTSESWAKRADDALYEAKEKGKNTVVFKP